MNRNYYRLATALLVLIAVSIFFIEKASRDAAIEREQLRKEERVLLNSTSKYRKAELLNASDHVEKIDAPRDRMNGDEGAYKSANELPPKSSQNVKLVSAKRAKGALDLRRGLDSQFGRLFKRLKLNPDDLDKLKDIMVARQLAIDGAMNSVTSTKALSKGFAGMADIYNAASATYDNDASILLGSDKYEIYDDYQKTIAIRGHLGVLEHRLEATDSRLQEEQVERLVTLITSASRANLLVPNISEEVMTQAGMFLNPTQLQALGNVRLELERIVAQASAAMSHTPAPSTDPGQSHNAGR